LNNSFYTLEEILQAKSVQQCCWWSFEISDNSISFFL